MVARLVMVVSSLELTLCEKEILESLWGIFFLQHKVLISSFLNFVPTIQYKTPLILWFRYCRRFITTLSIGWGGPLIDTDTAVGPVRIINVTETVINMAVPFMAALLRA